MSFVRLKNVSIEFPIYEVGSMSLRSQLLGRLGSGRIGVGAKKVITVNALRGISLDIEDGDRIALLGPNGAGKSTLLRTLGGIYEPSAGEIAISGKVANLIDINLGIDPELSGRENVFMRGLIMGMSRAEIRRKIQDIEQFAELGDSFELPVRTYSTGMALRLAFAVSTSIDPEILLIDEGISAGDQYFVKKAQMRARKIMGDSNILVLASHDMSLVSQLCAKAVLLREGRIEMTGPVEEVIEFYKKSD